MGILSTEGLAGTTKGSFFEAPAWVDQKLAPGRTPQSVVHGAWWPIIKNYLTTGYFFYSPNLVWFAIAAATYYLAPYDFETVKEQGFQPGWCLYRLFVNMFVTFSYFGFWNLTLYSWGMGTRKFNPTKNPTAPRMFHNMYYSALGVLQWTVWECCFVYAYANGKLGYVPDSQLFSTWTDVAKFAAWILFVPLYRDFHFYFAHRLLHIRVLYKFVHSLHHRNTDIEPFSGLCMHPVEHLFYFGCVGPSVYIHASPFIMMWNGIHLLISPAASHSGYEDHFQSDQFHFLHHAKFECNYGTSGPPLDKMFGTFREKLGRSLEFKGVADDIRDIVTKPNEYLSGSLSLAKAMPDRLDSVVYNSLVYATFAMFCARMTGLGFEEVDASTGAFLICYGPVLYGFVVLATFGDNKSYLWPFHKTAIFGELGFHLIISLVFVVQPVYHFAYTVLAEQNDGPYFKLQEFLYDSSPVAASLGNVTA